MSSSESTSTNVDKISQVTVLIERAKITAVELTINSRNELLIGEAVVYKWDPDTMGEIFTKISDSFDGEKLQILLGQDLASVATIVLGREDDYETAAATKAQKIFGDDFNNLGIDYSITNQSSDKTWVQLFAVKKSLLTQIGKALQATKLNVESIEPLSTALVRLNDTTGQTQLLLWGDSYLYVVLANNNHVVFAETIYSDNVYKQIGSLISSLEERYQLTIDEVIMASKRLNETKLKKKAKKVKKVDLNPFVGSISTNEEFAIEAIFTEEATEQPEEIAKNRTTRTKDDTQKESVIIPEDVVSAPKPPLNLVNRQKEEEPMESITPPPAKSNARLIAVIVTVMVVLIGMVVGGFFVYQNAMNEANTAPEVIVNEPTSDPLQVVEPVPTIEATDSAATDGEVAFDVSELAVQVLNGSGIPGAAGEVSSLLEDSEITDIDTGNADNYDYEETVIQVKSGEDGVYEFILTTLQSDYTVIQGEDLDDDSEYDVIITVGQT